MPTTLLTLVLTAATTAGLSAYSLHHQQAWRVRGITSAIPFRILTALQAALALATAAALSPHYGPAIALASAAACWLAALAVTTDLTCRMIPREIAHPVAAIGLLCALAATSTTTWLSLGTAALGLVVLPWIARVLTRGGLGFSDIRLLWALTATLSWWVGPTLLIYALIAAALAQGLVRVLARPLRLGTLVPVPGAPPATAQTPSADPAPSKAGVRLRRELPFAPAIVLAVATCTAYSAITGLGACHDWSPLSRC